MGEWSKAPSNNRAGSGGQISHLSTGGGCHGLLRSMTSQKIMRYFPVRYLFKKTSVVCIHRVSVKQCRMTDSSLVRACDRVGSLSKQVL